MGCGSSNASQNETSPMTALVSRPVTKKETKLPEVTGSPIGGPADPGLNWRDLLTRISGKMMWGDERREEREEWKKYLVEAEELTRKPRKPLPQDIVKSVMAGDLGQLDIGQVPGSRSKVVVFVSSTFTDTMAERNTLMRDVYPYLRMVSRILGLDFGAVDMRWGVREETTHEHGTLAMCLNEVERCTKESVGPAFLAIIGQKYGYRQFPPEIARDEFENIMQALRDEDEDVDVFQRHFQLDTNSVPPVYVLKARPKDKDLQGAWWDEYSKMQILLRKGAERSLPKEALELYQISVTENEMQKGIFDNEDKSTQAIIAERHLTDLEEEHHRHRHLIDMKQIEEEMVVDEDAQSFLKKLKEIKVCEALNKDTILKLEYVKNDEESCKEYIRRACDLVCERLVKSILKNYEDEHHVEQDETFQEVMQHRSTALEKCSAFYGREDLINKMTHYIQSETGGVYGLYGQSGCGKTALMAMAAAQTRIMFPNMVIIYRFLGTTGKSGSIRSVLRSVCLQICRGYGFDISSVPVDYKELVSFLYSLFPRTTKPLTIFLDSLDQLSNEDYGKNLKWLRMKESLPPCVKIVVSTIPGECLDILQSHLPSESLLEVKLLKLEDGPKILNKMLKSQNRKLTVAQQDIVLNHFEQCPLPLYLRMSVDVALQWRSYDDVSKDHLADDIKGLVTKLFSKLESRYGKLFVHHSLAYITASKAGLSAGELEDILSCDDEVLEEVFEYWLPPFRRIPQLLWIRIRNDIGMYLVERGTDNTLTYGWYHRQFWETARERYLNVSPSSTEQFASKAHEALADYFEGKWSGGKLYKPVKKNSRFPEHYVPQVEDRQVPKQPIVLSGARISGRKLNKRKLRELPYNLLGMKNWEKFENQCAILEFVEAKFEDGQGYECRNEFLEASKSTTSQLVKHMSKIIGSGLSHLLRDPKAIYQLASQQVRDNSLYNLYTEYPHEKLPHGIIIDEHPATMDDPCELTLQGHTSGVRCCSYSPEGDLIASVAEDASLRLWDAHTGMEAVTITDLPGPTFAGLADPYHGERQCQFSRDGSYVVTGSEDGWTQIWDKTGAMIKKNQDSKGAITGISFSYNQERFATCSKDGNVNFYDSKSQTLLNTISIGCPAMGCSYSSVGNRLAVAGHGNGIGLVLIDTSTNQITSSQQGSTGLNLCCSYSTDGHQVASGGDNSKITLWDGASGVNTGVLSGHLGWVWCVGYSPNGRHLLSCSSDRSLKMWDLSSSSCVSSLGGHQHRLTWVDFTPGRDRFVTASLDSSLKVWDFPAVAEGRIPDVGGLHYISLDTSPDGRYIVSSQGWSSSCNILDISTNTASGSTAAHDGFIDQTDVSPDSEIFVSLDTGHKGAYEAGAAYKAVVNVSSMSGGQLLYTCSSSDCRGPSSVTCGREYIVVGTVEATLHLFSRGESGSLVHSWLWSVTDNSSSGAKAHIQSVICCPTLPHVAASAGSAVKVYDISTVPSSATMVHHLIQDGGAQNKHLVYSPDGVYLAASDVEGSVRLWRVSDDYTLHMVLKDHVSMVKSLRFSPGSQYMVTGAVEQRVLLYKVGDFSLKAAFYCPVNCLAFKDDSHVFVGEATGNRKLLSWNL